MSDPCPLLPDADAPPAPEACGWRPARRTSGPIRARPAGLLAGLCLPCAAHATGAEMAGLALIVPMLGAIAVVGLAVLGWIIWLLLPARWPRARRIGVAAMLAPLAGVGLLLLVAGSGMVKMLLAKWLA